MVSRRFRELAEALIVKVLDRRPRHACRICWPDRDVAAGEDVRRAVDREDAGVVVEDGLKDEASGEQREQLRVVRGRYVPIMTRQERPDISRDLPSVERHRNKKRNQ